jgi:acyl-CoA synthetase (NDP forming)
VRPALEVDAAAARARCGEALLEQASAWLDPLAVAAVLGAFGLPLLESRLVRSARKAAEAVAELGGGPVALKAVAAGLTHKTDVGGVRLGLGSGAAAARAYRAMAAAVAEQGIALQGALVQPMAPAGVECLIGIASDPTFGPVVAFGAGGVLAELVTDARLRLVPITDRDADELLGAPRARALLAGHRGAPPGDVAAVRDVLLRVGMLAEEVPEIVELDLNPVLALPPGQGAVVLDARIRVERGGAR